MKKIQSLFCRNYETDKQIRNEVVPGSEWVIHGEGKATRKYDGTCCLIKNGKLFKRYEVKPGANPPIGFEPANDVDEITGKQQGWLPVGYTPENVYHIEGLDNFLTGTSGISPLDGTYELIGPKIQGNPENCPFHILIRHDLAEVLVDCPRTFELIREYLSSRNIEGIVWHHPDGRMVKIKAKDFGLKRVKVPTETHYK